MVTAEVFHIKDQGPVVQTLDIAIHQINHYLADKYYRKYCTAIHWIEIYPVDSVIHLMNYWSEKLKFYSISLIPSVNNSPYKQYWGTVTSEIETK